jgi:hypothetical protein
LLILIFACTPGLAQTVTIGISAPLAGKYKISIGTASFITGAAIGPVSLTFMPTATNMTLTIRKVAPVGGAIAQLGIKYITYDSVIVQPYTAVSEICSDDDYHYGFNGKMKVNEIAVVGNHNTAFYWEYDTRTGKRGNLDPIKDPWQSSYSTIACNPILFSDAFGDYIDKDRTKGKNIVVVGTKEMAKEDRKANGFWGSALTWNRIKARTMNVMSLGKVQWLVRLMEMKLRHKLEIYVDPMGM